MRRKLCICSEISRKAVMICKVLSLGCWCPPSFCKQQRISHCTGYTRLFDVNFTTKVTHSRTYLQSNKIAEKKSILNFGFTSPLRPSKDRTVVMNGAALATSSQLNHDTSLQFFDILQQSCLARGRECHFRTGKCADNLDTTLFRLPVLNNSKLKT